VVGFFVSPCSFDRPSELIKNPRQARPIAGGKTFQCGRQTLPIDGDELLEDASPTSRELEPLESPINLVSAPLDVASRLEPIAQLNDRWGTDAELLS